MYKIYMKKVKNITMHIHLETKTRKLYTKTTCSLAPGILDDFITYFSIFYNMKSTIYLFIKIHIPIHTDTIRTIWIVLAKINYKFILAPVKVWLFIKILISIHTNTTITKLYTTFLNKTNAANFRIFYYTLTFLEPSQISTSSKSCSHFPSTI